MQNKSIENTVARLLIFSGPFITLFILMEGVSDPVNITKMLVLAPLAFTLLGLTLSQWKVIRARDNSSLLIASTLFMVALFASVVFSNAPLSQLLFGNYGRNTGLITYLSFLFIFVATATLKQLKFSGNLLKALMIAGVVNALYGILQLTHNDPLPWNNTYNTILGTLGNPDFISAFLGITVVVSIAWLVAKSSTWKLRAFSLLYAILALIEIKKSHAIQGLAVTGIGIAVVGFYFVRAQFKNNLAVVGYAILVSIGGFMSLIGALQKGPLSHYIYKTSVSLRGEYWAGAINTGKSHPIFGVGLDTYGDWYRRERRPSALVLPGPNTVVNAAHNVFLDMFANGGLFLFISYLILLALSVRAIIRLTLRRKSYDATFVALTAGWIGFQAQSAVSINQIGLAIWGWLLGGALISYEICTRDSSPGIAVTSRKASKRRIQKANYSLPASTILIGALAGMIGLLLVIPPFMSDNRWYWAVRSTKVDLIQQAALSWPMDSFRLVSAASILADNNYDQQALTVAREATKFNPNDSNAWTVITMVKTVSQKEKANAIKHMKQLDPLNTTLNELK